MVPHFSVRKGLKSALSVSSVAKILPIRPDGIQVRFDALAETMGAFDGAKVRILATENTESTDFRIICIERQILRRNALHAVQKAMKSVLSVFSVAKSLM